MSFYILKLSVKGGVPWSSHLWGDPELAALWDHATARQLPSGGHTPKLQQLWLSERGRGWARRNGAARARPKNPRQTVQHVRRSPAGTLRLKLHLGLFQESSCSLFPPHDELSVTTSPLPVLHYQRLNSSCFIFFYMYRIKNSTRMYCCWTHPLHYIIRKEYFLNNIFFQTVTQLPNMYLLQLT